MNTILTLIALAIADGLKPLATVQNPNGTHYHVEDAASAHKLWALFLDRQDRFASGRPMVSPGMRYKLEQQATNLSSSIESIIESEGEKSLEVKLTREDLAEIEQVLGALDAGSYIPEDFRNPRSQWQPTEFSDKFTDEEIAIARDESLREMRDAASWLHKSRISLKNRCTLAKHRRIPSFNFKAAWAEWKEAAREIGAELRSARNFAKDCERELARRKRERKAEEHELRISATAYATSTGDMQEDGLMDSDGMAYMFPELKPNLTWHELDMMAKQAKADAQQSPARKRLLAKRRERSHAENKAIAAKRAAAIEAWLARHPDKRAQA